jgi:tetratricopeptide (TPR) repeat protein
MAKTGRNDPCPCGSGKKHKKCCLSGGVDQATHVHEAGIPPGVLVRDDDVVVVDPAVLRREAEHDALLARYFDLASTARYDEAEAVCRDMLRLFPELIDGHERLGEIYEARGKLLEAAEAFRLAAERMTPAEPNYDPGYVPFLLYRAEQAIRRAHGITPSDFEETADSVACDIARNELDRAELGILELTQRSPEHYVVAERQGQLCEAQRDAKGAARHFRLAARHAVASGADPAHVGYLKRRADVLDPPTVS